MKQFVTDTHPIVWHLTDSPQLSLKAKQIFEGGDRGENQIFIPSIVLVEIVYLAEKTRIDPLLIDTLLNLLSASPSNYLVAPLNLETVMAMRGIDPQLVPDMPDRIIVATAKTLNAPLISRDQQIAKAGIVKVIW